MNKKMILKLTAEVIKGKGRGKKLGFPTANLDVSQIRKLNLDFGVYICEVKFRSKSYYGLFHYGQKKTFKEGISVEIYILDFKGDLYGEKITVKIGKKIRGIKNFKNSEELKQQIQKDIEGVKNII